MSEHKQAANEAKKAPDLTPPTKGHANGAGQKKEAEAKEPKQKKEAKPKEPKAPRESNFKKVYPDNAVITVLTAEGKNPKRPGSAAYERFNAYGKGGVSVAEAIKAGATYADLSWDVGHGFIKVEAPVAVAA